MSSRGAGRGGGFGRRGNGDGSGSNTRALLTRTALEAGIDDRTHLTLQAITHPPLYPDLMWHSSGRQGHQHWASTPTAIPSASSLSSSAAVPLDPSAVPIAITSNTQSAALDSSSSLPPSTPTALLSNPKRPTSIVNLINKHREVLQAFAESAQHLNVSTSDSVADVPRWLPPHNNDGDDTGLASPAQRQQKPDVRVLARLGRLGTDSKYFPAELLPSHDPPPHRQPWRKNNQKRKLADGSSGWSRGNSSKATRWEELAQRETTLGASGAGAAMEEVDVATGARAKAGKLTDTEERDDDDDDDAADNLPADEEEDLEDYTKDYYESEGESDGGDGEATF